ncbi:unnamed protein product [Vitrella brassicaformis CCMP3155]|uniref:Uncharacterized protein n=1 Tax=Vitrella brassicaformis (strain CCMP3155) TaxID=1169540 RepID=A0A0G4EQ94_VITBC|nr:unnamed protein product [Vitrella brassicaformis CCMP3155]|eukprot:CEL99616.1 unnamed protein product [Vitrella brassicaformis CCMP3155]
MSSLPVLSFRMDSLLVQCVISAAIYYVPQDAAALIGAYWVGSTFGRKKVGTAKSVSDGDVALKAFMESRQLEADKVRVGKFGNTWSVQM